MAFSDLALKVGADSAVISAHKNIAQISLFAKSFSELNSAYGKSIAVPVYDLSVANDFNGSSNNYGTGDGTIGGAEITLNKHIVKSISITDQDAAETGVNWIKDTTAGIAESLARGVNKFVFEQINDTNCTLSASFNATAKSAVADLYKVAEDNDIPVDKAVVALTPTQFAKVLALLDADVYGGSEAIRLGVIPGLYGFKAFVCTSYIPASTTLSATPCGAVIADEAIGIASRYLAPATPDAYPVTFTAQDADNGFTIGYRSYMDLATGTNKFAGDVLFGAKVLQGNKIVRLV